MARILIFDIECYTHEFSADKGFLLCIGYKWLGEAKGGMIRPKDLKKFREDPTDDRQMCKEFLELVEQADAVVGWNSKGFDWRFLQTRIMKHRLGYLPPVPHVDLLMTSRNATKMRRSLDNTGKFFDLKNQKIPLDMNEWMSAGRGNPKALQHVIDHCEADILMTEEAYYLFSPLSRVHPNVAIINGKPQGCPRCGKDGFLQKRGKRTLSVPVLMQKGKIYALRHYRIRFQCRNCGHWPTSNPIKYGKSEA
jgi:hypothetical protein